MRLSLPKRLFVAAHYRDFKDADLAHALNVRTSSVTQTLNSLHLERSAENRIRLKEQGQADPPPYTGQVPLPRNPARLTVYDWLAAAVAACAVFLVYFSSLPPTVTGEDSGELIVAAHSLGIPHPPGYPLWVLLAHPFTYIPLGTIAWRVALSSAFFGSLAVLCLCLITTKLTNNRIASVAAALAFGFSQQFWAQNILAEVYALNTLLMALCILLLVEWYHTRRDRTLYVFAAIYGLSLCNHNTMLLLGPIAILFVLAIDLEPWRRWGLYLRCTLLALSMLLVYIYLPIRSSVNPPVDWGNPENWDNFLDVVRREQYAFALTQDARTIGRLFGQTGVILREYAVQFTPWLSWLPLLGAYALWKRSRLLCGFLVLIALTMSLGFAVLTNFDIDRQSVWLNSVFWIPAYLAAAILLGVALDWLSSNARLGRFRQPTLWLTASACVILPLMTHASTNNRSDYYFADDYGRNILATLEPDAIIFPTADHATFPVLYIQAAEGLRPDITIADIYGYTEKRLYEDMPEELRSQFRKIPTENEEQIIERWVIDHTDRPVYFTKKRTMSDMPGRSIMTTGLLYRVVRVGETVEPRDYWDEYSWHTLDPGDTKGEFSAEAILSDYYFARGRDFLVDGNTERGLEAFDLALEITGEDKEALNNFGSAAAENGAHEAARDYFERAASVDPEYDTVLRNLVKVYMELGEFEEALRKAEKLVVLDKADPETLFLSTICMQRVGLSEQALTRLDEMLALNPSDARVYKEAGTIYLNDRNDRASAQFYFSRSLTLDPNQPDLVAVLSTLGVQGLEQTLPGLDEPFDPRPQPIDPAAESRSGTAGQTTTPRAPSTLPPLPQLPQIPQSAPPSPRVP